MAEYRFRGLEGRASGGKLVAPAATLVAPAGFDGLGIDATSLQRLMYSEPHLAATLLLTLSRHLAERLEMASRMLALLPPIDVAPGAANENPPRRLDS